MIGLPGYHFRRSIAWGPTSCFKSIGFCSISVRKSKINNFDPFIWIEQQVFWFEISMANIYCMYVLNSSDQILIESACFSLSKSLLWDNIIEQFSPMTVLHDHVKFSFCFYYLKVKSFSPHIILQCLDDLLNLRFWFLFVSFQHHSSLLFLTFQGSWQRPRVKNLTFSPVWRWIAFHTFPNVPSPKAFPRM